MQKLLLNFLKTRTRYFWLILILSITIFISHAFYVISTHQQPEMDEHNYMDMASFYYKSLQNPDFNTPVKMLERIAYRQPGYSLFILPPLIIFGLSNAYKIALFLNVFFYIATIISIYFLGKEFFSKKSALIASILFSCYGWSLFYLHFTYSETATTGLVILSLLFLKKTSNFTDRKYSLFFGLFLGLGLLTRWVTLIFVIGPLLLVMFQTSKLKKNKRKMAFKNFVYGIITASLLACPPYIINYKSFFGYYVKDQALGGALWEALPKNKKAFISLQSAAYYLKVFEQLTIQVFSVFIVGLVFSIFKKCKQLLFLLLAFFVPWIIFSFATIIKDDRYIVPIYPIIALLSVSFLDEIRRSIIQKIVIFFIVIISIGNFFGAVWGIGPFGQKGLSSFFLKMPIGHPRYIHWTTLVWPPSKEISNSRMIIEIIDRNNDQNKKNVLQLFSYHPVDIGLYTHNNYQRVDSFIVTNFVGTLVTDPKIATDYVLQTIKESEFILTKDKNKIDNYFPPNNYGLLDTSIEVLAKNGLQIEGFSEIGKVHVPIDGSTVTVYKKTDKLSNEREVRKNLIKYLKKSTY